MSLYRGTISFEGPDEFKTHLRDNRDPTKYLQWKRAWREKNRERLRIYHREYMQTRKAKKDS